MSSSHMKRLTMPRSWPLPRKSSVWIQKPNPCGHPLERCMPLGVILRDVLGVAQNRREAKKIAHSRQIKVDGELETDTGRGVGLMDVLTVGENNYRCILDTNGKLRYRPISAKDASTKFFRVTGKTTIKGGKTQLHLHDGRNIIFEENPRVSNRRLSSHIPSRTRNKIPLQVRGRIPSISNRWKSYRRDGYCEGTRNQEIIKGKRSPVR